MSGTQRADLTTQGGDACPVCGAPAESRVDLGDYRLFRCPGCKSWSSDALERGARTSFDPEAYFENADADRERWEDLLRRANAGRAEVARILDVGCGRGDFLRFLSRRDAPTERCGIEIDPFRAAAARVADPAATVATGPAPAALAELPGDFDLITLWDVFEHLTDPRAVVPESIMPKYGFLSDRVMDASFAADLVSTNALVGVPYTSEMIEAAKADFAAQADPNADTTALLERYGETVNVSNFDGQAELTEMDALIAYLQVLGTMVDFSTFQPDPAR